MVIIKKKLFKQKSLEKDMAKATKTFCSPLPQLVTQKVYHKN